MVKKFILSFALALYCLIGFSQETFKTMFYNVLNFPNNGSSSRIDDLETILDDYRPDLFMICELNNEAGANTILQRMQTINSNYQRAVFVANTSDNTIGDSNDLQQMLFYDSSKFILESQDEVTSIYRDFNHYKLKINSVDHTTNPVYIDVFVTHLKASQDSPNPERRKEMVDDLEDYLDGLPSASNVILAGDLNLYTSTEPAFQELLNISGQNNITFIDPANRIGNWHNNSSFVDVFTQSTRTASGLGGASGGFDDRFDFILTSDNMETNPDISFVPNSYKVFGNNANSSCFNQAINSASCSGSDYDLSMRNALYNMSDHLPVTLSLQTNKTLSSTSFNNQISYNIIGSNLIRDELKINTEASKNPNETLTIYNNLGQKITTLKINNRNFIKLNVSYLNSGIYYIASSFATNQPLKFIKL